MSNYNLVKMQKKLKKYIDEMRFHHTLGVMYTAASLAMCHGEDIERTQVAGLLHDCAKCIPNTKKLKLCAQKNIPVSEIEQKSPYLLHARIGAYIAREKYHVEDPEILSAIEFHTTGKAEMTLLEKIIFIADYIEPMRNKAANLPEIRSLAFRDIDRAVYLTMRDTIMYLEKEKSCLDNQTIVAYNYYKELVEKKEA
ncbi:MAG: HD domain-containing protein [Lachnospiraceae bacterium]|jgi:predicted HD superfamily hydrolase involved in NAD metabolism|nr:HD domain-containing protein [Lachnospiraceae bacterium]RKJ50077.1 HD domain-containing protein [bacterium 1XD42-54]